MVCLADVALPSAAVYLGGRLDCADQRRINGGELDGIC